MAKNDTFHCSVITPERAVLETEATFVALPAHDGELGVLRNRAPMLYKLGTGELRVDTHEGRQIFFVDGGFAQMVENRLTLLTEQAKRLDEIDAASVERALAEARDPTKSGEQSERAVKRALAQKRLLAKRRSE